MAISIDAVYQKVLALANKEQRGYITPQEFNLFAEQAQLEIFEQYFYDLNQYLRIHNNNEEYSDIIHNLNEKISLFEKVTTVTGTSTNRTIQVISNKLWRLGTVYVGSTELEEVQQNEILTMHKSKLTEPSYRFPVYVRKSEIAIDVYPSGLSALSCTYVAKPQKPIWGYVVINSRAMYDATNTTNFELHMAEESELIYKILKIAGLSMQRDDLSRGAQGLESMQVQQEKQ